MSSETFGFHLMQAIAHSLQHQHDHTLVFLAAVICALGSATVVLLARRGTKRGDPARWFWAMCLCAGLTVWSTHFVAMLAFATHVNMRFDLLQTIQSFAAGAVLMSAGFALARQGPALLGGAVVGLGVAVLHYVGMAAIRLHGTIAFDAILVAVSVGLSVALGMAALGALYRPERGIRSRPLGGLLFLLMTVLLHFTGMAAVDLQLEPGTWDQETGITRGALAIVIAIASLAVLLIGAVARLVDTQMSMRLALEAERFRALAEGAFEGIVLHRRGRLLDANRAAQKLLKLPEDFDDITISDFFGGEDLSRVYKRAVKANQPAEVSVRRSDGTFFPAEISHRRFALKDSEEGELIAVRDISARKEVERLALHDALTSLPNRTLFLELANNALAQAGRNGEGLTIMALDLDNFKFVNDVHGHQVGDRVLKIIAERIGQTLRKSDVAARLAGDEFALLLPTSNQSEVVAPLANRLLESVTAPIALDTAEVVLTASLGLAMYPGDGRNTDQLLRNADTAMHRAKSDGKSTYRFFETHMDAALAARRRLESRLRNAIKNEQLYLAYQPLISSRSGEVVCFEALMRWEDEELGSVSPAEFIPVAEETGLIIQMGEFALRQACKDAAGWPQPTHVAVNLSAVQFRRPGLIDAVRAALADNGLPGERLELEITESVLLDKKDDALTTLKQLKALGTSIAMDDFGTGYSSLSYLQSFEFDKLKIDRSFVSSLEADRHNASIVQAVTFLGKSLNMTVVAEGVESHSQADLLRKYNCDQLQGFVIARPMPNSRVTEFLAAPVEYPIPKKQTA